MALGPISSWQKSIRVGAHRITEAIPYHYQDSDCINRYNDISHRGTEYDLYPYLLCPITTTAVDNTDTLEVGESMLGYFAKRATGSNCLSVIY